METETAHFRLGRHSPSFCPPPRTTRAWLPMMPCFSEMSTRTFGGALSASTIFSPQHRFWDRAIGLSAFCLGRSYHFVYESCTPLTPGKAARTCAPNQRQFIYCLNFELGRVVVTPCTRAHRQLYSVPLFRLDLHVSQTFLRPSPCSGRRGWLGLGPTEQETRANARELSLPAYTKTP